MKPADQPIEEDVFSLFAQGVGGMFFRRGTIDGILVEGFVYTTSLFLAILIALCFGAYESLRRRARYREEQAFRRTKDAFLDDLVRLDDEPGGRRQALLAGFEAAVRDAERVALQRWEAERVERPEAAWLAPRASARRREHLRRRTGAWLRWAEAACAAAARGRPVPPEPGARRRTGAPVRRLCRASVNPMPDIQAVADAYRSARGRGRVAEKIRCGSLLLDAEAGVDSSLVRTETGEIVGRNPGLRGWICDQAPWLLKHYVSLMQYRRLAQAFREAHGLRDPVPASALLDDAAAAVFPKTVRGRIESARNDAKTLLGSGAARTVRDFRQALARREWRRTG